jgi:hypothetical protein
MHDKLTLSITRGIQFGAALTLLVACSSSTDGDSPGTAGAGSAGKGAGGGSNAAAGSTSATAGAAPAGGSSGSPSTTGGAGSTGVSGSFGTSGGSGGTGGSVSSGGAGAAGGSIGAAGSGTAGASAAGSAGSAGSTGAAGSGGFTPPTGENSIAYIGCSMANNIGTGYGRVGGKIMWNANSYQTGAMVVQNWTSTTSASWKLFDQKMSSIGGKDKVKAIMVQICIFPTGATQAELKAMVASARDHVNPGTHIYIVGQPNYQTGHSCSLAGTQEGVNGAVWTDQQAQKLAADASVNQDMTYLGKFMLDSTKGEVMSDTCHATSPKGEDVLGNQAKAFFGG